MHRSFLITTSGILLSILVLIPFIFESYTFYLYNIGEPAFFIFSGARLWVFLTTMIGIGIALGWVLHATNRNRFFYSVGFLVLAIFILSLLLYQFCDVRQCYYTGPDGFGWLRLGVLLFVSTSTGLLIGSVAKMINARPSSGIAQTELGNGSEYHSVAVRTIFFATSLSLFVGYYPVALLFGIPIEYPLSIGILSYAATVPSLLCGIISRLFSRKTRYAVYSSLISSAILAILFVGLGSGSILLVAIIAPIGALASVGGHRISQKYLPSGLEATSIRSGLLMYPSIVVLFFLAAVHPFFDAPMNLAPQDENQAMQAVIARPTYYAGAYHNEPYFPTKRVEVELDLRNFDASQIKDDKNFVLAGIGAQSPNCCKDGLDYGYRSDLLFTSSGTFVVARAWETCDQNIGCSGFPWQSTMHKELIQLPTNNITSVMLAMEWDDDDVTSHWYYKINDDEWTRYSSFVSPEIENPYYNLGVIQVNPLANPMSGNAYFYQAGVSTTSPLALNDNKISFVCPSYYDTDGSKRCTTDIEAVRGGESHWKVLWKWGQPKDDSVSVLVDGEKSRIDIVS